MKKYANKFPKAWEDLDRQLQKEYEIRWAWKNKGSKYQYGDWHFRDGNMVFMPDNFLFGYLVFEYFPAHGIEIERLGLNREVYYRVLKYKTTNLHEHQFEIYGDYDTPEEAISKAFEIREKQLDGK